jgi:hypothetical protein
MNIMIRCDKLANNARLKVLKVVEYEEKNCTITVNGSNLDKPQIGKKKTGVVCLWYKDILKIIDLDQGIIEDYNKEIHGKRDSVLEIGAKNG